MCRYAFQIYKSHFACFSCRKTFKKLPIEDWVANTELKASFRRLCQNKYPIGKKEKIEKVVGFTLEEINQRYLDEVSSCPDCGLSMASMGLDFKAPPKKDKEAWDIIGLLHKEGFAFKGCGCDVGYSPPEKKSDLAEFFAAHQQKTDGQILLEKIKANAT